MSLKRCTFLFAVLMLAAVGQSTVHAAGCGLRPLTPIAPIGCKRLAAECVCDSRGNCDWQFVCVN